MASSVPVPTGNFMRSLDRANSLSNFGQPEVLAQAVALCQGTGEFGSAGESGYAMWEVSADEQGQASLTNRLEDRAVLPAAHASSLYIGHNQLRTIDRLCSITLRR